MPKIPYAKPATTYAQQVEQLKSRGMIIPDEDSAKLYLQHLNYYRLSAYWLPFESDHGSHTFKPDTNFSEVIRLYSFDRELRILLLDAIERIEVSVRTQWAYKMSHLHGAHAHLKNDLAHDQQYWSENIADLEREVSRSDEIFIKHLVTTYSERLPPIWAICEVMSLGLLSRWYSNLKPFHTRAAISNVYGIDESVFGSWLHHLSVVRNVCAHHSRLWNRGFQRVPPKATINKPSMLKGQFVAGYSLYNTLVIILYLVERICEDREFKSRLISILQSHKEYLSQMGFPEDWDSRPIWI